MSYEYWLLWDGGEPLALVRREGMSTEHWIPSEERWAVADHLPWYLLGNEFWSSVPEAAATYIASNVFMPDAWDLYDPFPAGRTPMTVRHALVDGDDGKPFALIRRDEWGRTYQWDPDLPGFEEAPHMVVYFSNVSGARFLLTGEEVQEAMQISSLLGPPPHFDLSRYTGLLHGKVTPNLADR